MHVYTRVLEPETAYRSWYCLEPPVRQPQIRERRFLIKESAAATVAIREDSQGGHS